MAVEAIGTASPSVATIPVTMTWTGEASGEGNWWGDAKSSFAGNYYISPGTVDLLNLAKYSDNF
jgi:hypothetical protein